MNVENISKRKTSDIWDHFEIVDMEFAKCKLCKAKFSYKTSISNLKRHYEKKHFGVIIKKAKIYNTMMSQSENENRESQSNDDTQLPSTSSSMHVQPFLVKRTVQDSLISYTNKKLSVSAKNKIDSALMKLFVKDMQPFSVVEDEGFKDFVKELNPSYNLPSRHHISNSMLPVLYEQVFETMKQKCKNIEKQLEEAIKCTIAVINKNLPTLTANEWEILKELTEILESFESVTNILSGEKYATVSVIIILANGLKDVVERQQKDHRDAEIQVVLSKLLENINGRWKDIENNDILICATFLDPRFKNIGFKNERTFNRAKTLIIEAIANIIGAQSESEHSNGSSSNEKDNDNIKISASKYNVWSFIEKSTSLNKRKMTPATKIMIEIERYLEEDIADRNQNPLFWWKEHQCNYPLLKIKVKELFGIIATSVPCERLFSKAGYVLNDRRTRLTAEKLKQILFLQSNL